MTTPSSPAVGDPGTAAWADLVATDIGLLLNPPIARVYQTSVQAIGNAAYTPVTFDTEAFDTYAGHDNVTNNTGYFAQIDGYYRVTGLVTYATNATGIRVATVFYNGGNIADAQVTIPALSGFTTSVPTASIILHMVAGDYVQIAAYQTSGGNLNTVTTQSGMTIEWVHA